MWISRIAWIEALSKCDVAAARDILSFLSRFGLDEIDDEIAPRAAALRRERPRLNSPDAIILATAQIRGRVLVTRSPADFSASIPGLHHRTEETRGGTAGFTTCTIRVSRVN